MPPDRAAARAVADDGAVLTGIAFKLGAVGVFATMAALVKALDGAVPVNQVVFARSFFALIPILWLVHRAGIGRAHV